ncbi:hypothetical protein DPEC_G00009810 [Dallia pectoralis]|uniref:Uncharacterized protein n=1 Tax=Dallia pectoralis TaxID=75939 RepID=A0ACC2HL05_DALPE|nr:hypothetical protein DPEC_G00009810 [Dallia pectoralis]
MERQCLNAQLCLPLATCKAFNPRARFNSLFLFCHLPSTPSGHLYEGGSLGYRGERRGPLDLPGPSSFTVRWMTHVVGSPLGDTAPHHSVVRVHTCRLVGQKVWFCVPLNHLIQTTCHQAEHLPHILAYWLTSETSWRWVRALAFTLLPPSVIGSGVQP